MAEIGTEVPIELVTVIPQAGTYRDAELSHDWNVFHDQTRCI